MNWRRVLGQLLGLAAMFAVGFSLLWYGSANVRPLPPSPVSDSLAMAQELQAQLTRHAPVLVTPHQEHEPGDSATAVPTASAAPSAAAPTPTKSRRARHPVFDFDFGIDKPLLMRRRLPIQMTMYCLQGTTRSGLPVRPGIIAADPRVLPLGTTVDVYVGLKYYGRFLVDDTGRLIKGAIIDIWTPSCQEAIRFGRRRGAVVLVEPTKKRQRGR